jgi:hypothetical protein
VRDLVLLHVFSFLRGEILRGIFKQKRLIIGLIVKRFSIEKKKDKYLMYTYSFEKVLNSTFIPTEKVYLTTNYQNTEG